MSSEDTGVCDDASNVEDLSAIAEMFVSAESSEEDDHDSDVLGKRKREQTNHNDPSGKLSAAGPSRKTSKKRSLVVQEVLDEVTPSKEIQALSGRLMLKKVLLDLTGDEADIEVNDSDEMANKLESWATFNKKQKSAFLVHVKSFVKPM